MSVIDEDVLSFDADRRYTLHSSYSLFGNAEVGDFCPTELFEVVLANELTPNCLELLKGIIQANKNEEIFPNLVFITKEDISEFITTVNKTELDNFWHPPQLIKNLRDLCTDIAKLEEEKEEIPKEMYARLMKHQLISKMCAPTIQKAEMDQKLWILNQELEKLRIFEDKNSLRDTKLKKNKLKRKKIKKKVEKYEEIDFMLNTSLTNDSDDLKDHIYFYIFAGFKDPAFLKMLPKYLVPINCVLQISSKEYVSRKELDYFWKEVNEMSKSFEEYKATEDMIHMKYVYNSQIPDEEREDFFKQRLIELYDILMEIPQLKRKHVQYIKHLYPFEFEEREFRFGPFPFYEANMDKIAIEFVTIPYIISSIIREVDNNLSIVENKCMEDTSNKVCRGKPDEYHHEHEVKSEENKFDGQKCPLRLSDFKKPRIRKSIPERESRVVPRKFHEGDNLNIILTLNKNMKDMALSDFQILSHQKLLEIRRKYEDLLFCRNEKGTCISRSEITPRLDKPLFTKEQTDHFLNLLFLSNMNISVDNFRSKQLHSKYLCTGDEVFEDINFLPDSIILGSCENLFERFDSMLYSWIEPLPTTVLVQRLHVAQQEFSTCKFHYSYQTNTLLVYFHQNLTSSGTRSRVWRESLRTLTCLRDFCNFYIFEDADWLSKHPPVEQVKYEQYMKNQETYFFQRLIESDNRYREYNQFLTPYRYCGDTKCQGELSCFVEECNRTDASSHLIDLIPNLGEIITEIKNYSASDELNKHCANARESDTILSFDRRPQRFGLTGSTHEFFSHDGVKITIDTCRFYFEDFKLTFSVDFDKHILFGHFTRSDLSLHVVLADDTVVNFCIIKAAPKIKKTSSSDIKIFENLERFSSLRRVSWNEGATDSNENHFERERRMLSFYENGDFNVAESTRRMIPDEESKEMYTKLLKRLIPTNNSYKFAHHKTNHLSTNFKKQKIAYSSVITRILRNNLQQEDVPVYHRSILVKDNRQNKSRKDEFSIKITLPNGLMIESLPSKINDDDIAIKQMHSESKFNKIRYEDYRLFFENGLILIRCSNGNMRILDAEGTIVELREKTPRTCFDPYHEKCLRTIEMCRKKMYILRRAASIKKNKFDLYSRSRRGHLNFSTKLNTKQSNILDDLNKNNLPFSEIDLFSIDGKLYKIREHIVSRNLFAKFLDDYDFIYHETLRQRTDNMKLLYKNDGSVISIFPDGTKITKLMLVDKNPEFFRKRDNDGWVIIRTNYLYEHPCYAPIEFKDDPKITLIHLKEDIKLKLAPNECDIIFNNETNLNVNSERINFKKLCPKCGSDCTCDINIELMDFKENTEKSEPFLIFKDSYNKQFTSDFQGRCKVNTDFINGELNKRKCNHYGNNDYQKVFLIHGDLSGDLLWNERMVIREVEKIEKQREVDPLAATLQEFTTRDKSMTSIKFMRNVYVELSEKYLWPKYMFPMVFLRKSDFKLEQVPVYQMCRSIFNMIQDKEVNDLKYIFKKISRD